MNTKQKLTKQKLENRLAAVMTELRGIAHDEISMRLKKYYAEGQQVALQDALSYLKEEEKKEAKP